MINDFLLLLLPAAAWGGWYYSQKKYSSFQRTHKAFPDDYFVGLNYLINEEPDKAVDVFIKMLEVNSDTIETHLALGSLFRRRGEVDRAIRVHQNIIARPQLNKQQRIEALFELAQDYLRAGVLDRAERLLIELIEMNEKKNPSLFYLLHIYQQQKDWNQAILIAQQVEAAMRQSMRAEISHYYCELAERSQQKNNYEQALHFLKQAITTDNHCVRANILRGQIAQSFKQWREAISYYKQIENQDPEYISEIIIPLANCYEKLGEENDFMNYLRKILIQHPRISIILVLSEYLRKYYNDYTAIEFIAEQIRKYPSLRGLEHLVQIYLANSRGDTKDKLLILHDLVEHLLADKPIYQCYHCGFASKMLYWQCPRCRSWSTVKPIHGVEGD